jgi:hypothetical protein
VILVVEVDVVDVFFSDGDDGLGAPFRRVNARGSRGERCHVRLEELVAGFIQQTPVTARATPKNYLVRYLCLRVDHRGLVRQIVYLDFCTRAAETSHIPEVATQIIHVGRRDRKAGALARDRTLT